MANFSRHKAVWKHLMSTFEEIVNERTNIRIFFSFAYISECSCFRLTRFTLIHTQRFNGKWEMEKNTQTPTQPDEVSDL